MRNGLYSSTARFELVEAKSSVVERIWSALEPLATPSYFLTWGWVETWLDMLPADEKPKLAIVRDGDQLRAAFFVGRRHLVRHGFVPSRALHLNTTGVSRRDELCIEHNSILVSDCSWTVGELVSVLPPDWDELFLPGVAASHANDQVPAGYRQRVLREVASPYVDLERVRRSGYLPLLSANTRQQIRRAGRRLGTSELEVATSPDQARAILDELVELHEQSWKRRGLHGAFADPWFLEFHRRLIEKRFSHGEVLLARLRAGSSTVGCLYCFVAYGRVLFYQSGLASFEDAVIKPGLLAHAALVEHAAAAGHAVYDLLGGDSRYKASLATGAERLAWLCVQRDLRRFAVEDRLRDWKQRLRGARP
jgi:CelD/BcsL family acetyltransferase involved in cellulose biosynthesis